MALPRKASHPTKCSAGGTHTPRGAEMKDKGVPVKFEKCSKCGLRVGDRK